MHQDPSICISAPVGTRVLYFHFLHAFLSSLYIYLRRREDCRVLARTPTDTLPEVRGRGGQGSSGEGSESTALSRRLVQPNDRESSYECRWLLINHHQRHCLL